MTAIRTDDVPELALVDIPKNVPPLAQLELLPPEECRKIGVQVSRWIVWAEGRVSPKRIARAEKYRDLALSRWSDALAGPPAATEQEAQP